MAINGWILNLKVSSEVYRYSASKYPFIVFKKAPLDHENLLKYLLSYSHSIRHPKYAHLKWEKVPQAPQVGL